MRSKGIVSIFALLILMLSILGVAYSAWKDKVVISGTVEMGEFIVGILKDAYGTGVDYELLETTNGYPEEEFEDPKPWVANTIVSLSGEETSKHHTPTQTVYKSMTITISNAYPQYDVHLKFKLKNAGTIPAVIAVSVSGSDDTDDEDLVFPSFVWDSEKGAWVAEGSVSDTAGHEIANIVITAYLPKDLQLEPCNEYEVLLDLDFKQTAEECHTYSFTVTINAVQWNKPEELP